MKKIILVNVYYNPNRFGGATIVVEEMAKWLNNLGWQVLVVTSHDSPMTMYRYKVNNIDVVSINQRNQEILNEQFGGEYSKVLKSFKPDVVHFHSIQSMGVEMLKITNELNIPFVTTLHDHWWKCDKQFMIARDGKYCFQEVIDLDFCQKKCGIDKPYVETKNSVLFEMLHKSEKILVPSQYFKDFYVENGFDAEKLCVNKNGIKLPEEGYRKSKSENGTVRFGFVGGPGPIKGLDLIVKAMENIENTNYELILVDAAKNINTSWYSALPKISGSIKVVDPYNQDTIDSFFSTIDVLLFPSQWKESFGLTVREALIRDVWVISTNGGGTIEDLRDGENSKIIQIGDDPTELKAAIESCISRTDWDSYTNEYKSDITSFEKQTRRLEDILMKIIK